jgi:nitrite reductase/ring-hydroxylating ferredoxin subunit
MAKIRKILILCIPCLFFAACGAEEDGTPLPYISVNVIFNMNAPPYNIELNLPSSAMKIKKKEAGYNLNGLILVRKSDDDFVAYDATCTRNIQEEITSLELDGYFYAYCPKCKTQYYIQSGGYETGGKFRLQEYRAVYNSKTKIGNIIN